MVEATKLRGTADLQRRRLLLAGGFGLLNGAALAAARNRISLVYPEMPEPFRAAFATIVKGVQERLGAGLQLHRVAGDAQAAALAEALREQSDLGLVLALGRAGIKVAAGLPPEIPVLASGVVLAPPGLRRPVQVLSLAPDPAALFARLKAVQPMARRVHLAYDPQHNLWLQRSAAAAAKELRLELLSQEVADLSAALRVYQAFIDRADPQQDALWLPQDPTSVQDSAVLPLLLRASWERGLLVFSSNLNHVSHGLLFALYPDNLELGRRLGQMATELLVQPVKPGSAATTLQPTRTLRAAINLKTADHLNLRLPQRTLDDFHLYFPEP